MSGRFELHFELEPRCPLDCIHCSSQAMRRESRQYDDSDILRFLRRFQTPPEIYLTGGEPLLYPGLLTLLQEASSQIPGCQFGLFTTGIVSAGDALAPVGAAYLSELVKAGLQVCYVSVYSDEAEQHDRMTRRPGSFDCTLEAIRRMTAAGIDTRINLVITGFNRHRISRIAAFAAELGVSELRLLKLIRHGGAVSSWEEIGLTDEEYLSAILAAWDRRDELPLRLTVSSLPLLTPCRPAAEARGCQAGYRLLYVALSGEVYPCACVKNRQDAVLFPIQTPNPCFFALERELVNASREQCLSNSNAADAQAVFRLPSP